MLKMTSSASPPIRFEHLDPRKAGDHTTRRASVRQLNVGKAIEKGTGCESPETVNGMSIL